MLKDSVKGLIIKLSLPVIVTSLLNASYGIVDMVFASRLGGLEVASVAFVTPMFRMIMALGVGLSTGGISVIAKQIGEGDQDKVSKYAFQLRSLIIVWSLTFAILGLLFTDYILNFLGLEGEMLYQSIIYTRIRFLSIPLLLLFSVYLALYNAQGNMNMTLKMSVLGLISNAVLNAFYIYVLKSDIGGLAYATTQSQGIQAVVIIILFHKNNSSFGLDLNIFKEKFNLKICKKLFKIGMPLAFSQSSTSLGFLLMNMFIVGYGYEVVAGFTIGNRINSMFFMVTAGIGRSIVPLIAQNWGNRSYDRLKDTIRIGMIYSFVMGLFGSVMIQLIVIPLATFLAKGDQLVFTHTVNFVRIVGWTVIAWGIFQGLTGVFNGFQMTKISMIISIVRLWVLRIPLLIFFRYIFTAWDEYGVWWTMFISNSITAICSIVIYYINNPLKNLER